MKIHDVITEKNWVKGRLGILDDCHCALGWIAHVYRNEALESLATFKIANPEICAVGVVPWNDNPSTTFPEVLAAFKLADL